MIQKEIKACVGSYHLIKLDIFRKINLNISSNCWAFSAIGSIEGVIRRKYNKTVHLSVQQLTDCSSDSNYGNDGCKGGNVWNAYRYIYENGIIEDSEYPFYSGKIGSEVYIYILKYYKN
jgi:hypothetical protein